MKFRLPPLDWPLAFATLGLIGIGLATVYSATSVPGAHQGLWAKQFLWFVVALGFAVYGVFCFFQSRYRKV